ncbi:MAG: hypothetical protein FJ293_05575 [Planctomycetes bacterium]|nr:hypothetical protein [Planctomycetota bacterium]
MRASTWIFFGLVAAFVCFGGRGIQIRRTIACEHRPCRAEPVAAVDPSRSSRVRALEREHAQLLSRGRELDLALQAIDGSLRTLRQLAKDGGAAIASEAAAVEAGRDRLLALRQANAAQAATAAARAQLAKAGIEDALPPALTAAAAPGDPLPVGPLEALNRLDVETATNAARPSRGGRDGRVTSRER